MTSPVIVRNEMLEHDQDAEWARATRNQSPEPTIED